MIKSNKQFDRLVAQLEELDTKKHATAEERGLGELLAKLVEDYDAQHYPAPDTPPHEMGQYFMEQRGLRQADSIVRSGQRPSRHQQGAGQETRALLPYLH